MAPHVDSTADIFVPALSIPDFKAQLQHGDILICSGQEPISLAIERQTHSPWSHVGYVALFPGSEPLLVEAVFKFGVRASRLEANYLGAYNGDVVLCRRTVGLIPPEGHAAIVAKAISRLGDDYDWQSEIQQAAHNLCGFLPEHATLHKLYCSGLVQYGSTAWSNPLRAPNPNVMPSPEDIWTDPTVWPVCKLPKGVR
jgi:hypothetical protein